MADGCRYVHRRSAVWILRSCEAQHGAPFAPIESVEPLLYPSKGWYALWAKSEALTENLFHEKEMSHAPYRCSHSLLE